MLMKINIGNNNKIKNSTIGTNNIKNKEDNKNLKMFWEVLVAVVSGLIVGYIIYKLGWN